MKIGLPRLRLSRKLLFITLGITVLLGGSGVTALYFGGQNLLVEGGESAIGGECVDVQTMVVKTPSNHLWLRKFIRMENASGHERVRTALRISGILAKNNAVDLIHVSVLDTHGPTKRADMRARAIGAEVLIALKPDNLPEMKSPAMASYYEGPVSDEGRYYGDKVVVDIDEIGSMMTAMRTIDEKPDCTNPKGDAEAAAKNDGHGKTDKKDGHDKPKEGHDKPANDHGEQPANDHDEKPANDHGEEPKEGADAAEPAKEQSFVDSMLSMVGLGGEEEKPAAETSTDAPAEGHDTAKSSEGHDEQPAAEDHSTAKTDEAVAEEPADAANGHDTAEPAKAEEAKPAENAGHETGDNKAEPAAEDHSAAETPAAAEHESADTKADAAAQDGHAPAEDAAAPAPAEDDHAAEAAPDAAAEDHGETPTKSDANDHGNSKKPAPDEHAEVEMPVGD